MGRSHGADRVADSTLIGAADRNVNRLYGCCLVVQGKADTATGIKRLAIFYPLSGADGARGLTGEVGGAFIFLSGWLWGCGWWLQTIKSVNFG